ncbi:MAG: glycosyltransferase family 4 protein [Bacteroidota bacterium]
MKKIALLTDGIWPDMIGGMQKHSFYLIKYLVINGYKVDVYFTATDSKAVIDQFSFDEALNITFYKVEQPPLLWRFPGHYVYSAYQLSKSMYKAMMTKEPYDFVYAQGFTGWYSVNKGIKVGSNLHGLEMFQKVFGLKSQLIRYLLQIPAKPIIKKSHINFSLGGKLTAILKEQGAKIICETPIGIGEEWLNKSNGTNTPRAFVFVGRNEKRKGLDLLFKVIQSLHSQQFKFHFIGIEQPAMMKGDNRCVFYGEEKNPLKIRAVLQQSDVLVCPSIAEGMPTVILEAMASGLAILATDTGATSLMVGNDNGLLVTPGDQNAISNGLLFFINADDEKLLQLKDNSYTKLITNFIWPISIKATIRSISSSE